MIKLLLKYKWYIAIIFVLIVIEPSLNSVLNFWIQRMFNSATPGANIVVVIRLLTTGFLLWMLKRIISYASAILKSRYICNAKQDLKSQVFRNLLDFDTANLSAVASSGEYISLFTNDINLVETRFLNQVISLISGVFSILILGVSFFALSAKLATAIIAFGVIAMFVPLAFSKPLNEKSLKYSNDFWILLSVPQQRQKSYLQHLRSYNATAAVKEKYQVHDFWELLQKKDSTGTLLDATVADEEKEFQETGSAVYTYFRKILNFYVYAPMDFSNFGTAILNFEYSKLRDLQVRDEHNYAVASDEFFSDPLLPLALYVSQITPAVAGFTLKPNVRQEFVVVENPTKEGQKIVSRRLHFCRIMDFLVTDFFEGLHAGHAPKQCPVCNRFFLTTNARPRKYCDGYAPNDPRGRTCQQVGARKKRDEREQADDHPVKQIYNTRCNTIDHHVRYGKIDRVFAKTAKRIAKDRQSKALRDNEYQL